MPERVSAAGLLRRARAIHDDPNCPLAGAARKAWQGGFASGARWMRRALEFVRQRPLPEVATRANTLGVVKYGLALAATFPFVAGAFLAGAWPLLLLCVPAFYAVEAQMVFLFPLALDGGRRPFHEARRWTTRAGGTLAVMRVVLPLAVVMVFGGFARQGVVRSWCLGCLAICLWYEDLRHKGQEGLPACSGHRIGCEEKTPCA
jgi:hypothetical protein